MKRKGRAKYLHEWTAFVAYLRRGLPKPDNFDDAWAALPGHKKVCGLFQAEAWALWKILDAERVETICEIGRNLGGGLFMLACACQNLRYVRSIEIEPIAQIDAALEFWLDANHITHGIQVGDSREVELSAHVFDFVFVDGGHTGECVRADIETWRPRTRLIGFHDFADRGARNKHVRRYKDVVHEIQVARDRYAWRQVGTRGRSEIVFRTGVV